MKVKANKKPRPTKTTKPNWPPKINCRGVKVTEVTMVELAEGNVVVNVGLDADSGGNRRKR